MLAAGFVYTRTNNTYPNRNTNTTLVPNTRLRNTLVHIRLNLEFLLRDREVESDIELGVCKVDIEIRETL